MKNFNTWVLIAFVMLFSSHAFSSVENFSSLKAFSADSKVNLYWKSCSDALSYQVFRSKTSEFEDETMIFEKEEYSFADADVDVGEEYFYRVVAVIAENEKVDSNPVTVKVYARPSSVTTSAVAEDGRVALTWQYPEGSSPVFGYKIYRSTKEDVNTGELVHVELGSGFSEFIDDLNTVNGETYYYKIIPYNEWGDGLSSEVASATPCEECKK